MRAPTWIALAAALAAAGCGTSAPAPAAPKPVGVDTAAMNTKISPCQDFYQYACGNWVATHPIPPDQNSWGTFQELAEHNLDELHRIAEQAKNQTLAGQHVDQPTREVGDYYAACMNEAGINAAGVKPMQSELDNINSLSSKSQLGAEIARLQVAGVNALFNFGSTPDFKDANSVIAGVDQAGIALPDRDYYTKTDAKSVELRKAYVAHVQKMFELLGDPAARAAMESQTVLRIETALAKASMTNVARRDPNAVYHKMSTAQADALAPSFDWSGFYSAAGAPSFNSVNVATPGFFRAINTELQSVPLNDWKIYLRWQLVHTFAPTLSQPFVDANFEFFGATLTGQKAQSARWKRCVRSTDAQIGDALGQLYVAADFTPQAKAHMLQMVENLEASLGKDIQTLDWMTAPTRQQALTKLHAIVNKIGYPDKWKDYNSITFSRDNYFTDLRRTNAYAWQRDMAKIGKPVDRSEWQMTPPTVDAYYTPLWNQIVFPAGILQLPFYSPQRDLAGNYGGVGIVIGHEMTHGFDDQGRQFDAQGNLKDWWTPADAKAFQERAACIVQEYSRFSPLPGVHLNGKLTLGENTADNGGARIAYAAMETALAGQPDTPIDGFNRAQRFFLAYGQLWCQNIRPETARLLANVDPHSPGNFRIIGVVQNMPEFAEAFHCGPNTPMNAGPKACRVW